MIRKLLLVGLMAVVAIQALFQVAMDFIGEIVFGLILFGFIVVVLRNIKV